MGGAKGAGWITGTPGGRGSEFGGRQVDSRLSFGFRCDKEMKPNPCGFNLNFDEFFDLGASEGRCIRRFSSCGCQRLSLVLGMVR